MFTSVYELIAFLIFGAGILALGSMLVVEKVLDIKNRRK